MEKPKDIKVPKVSKKALRLPSLAEGEHVEAGDQEDDEQYYSAQETDHDEEPVQYFIEQQVSEILETEIAEYYTALELENEGAILKCYTAQYADELVDPALRELNSGIVSGEIDIKATIDVMKFYEEKYLSRRKLLAPDDPRTVEIEVAIYTWILKFAGIIESPFTIKLTEEQRKQGAEDPCAEFRNLYRKTGTQMLNAGQWSRLKDELLAIAKMVLNKAQVIIAVAVQGQTSLLKDVVFQQVIIDEISLTTHLELLCAWRGNEDLTLIGDTKQLPTTTLSTPAQNPFHHVQSFGPFQRWTELGMPVFPLREIMRMTNGLEDLCNVVFYSSKLIPGPTTALNDPMRGTSRQLRTLIQQKWPQLTADPEGKIFPVFFNVPGECVKERNSSSLTNGYNVAFIIHLVNEILGEESLQLSASDIGVSTPYAAQVRLLRRALRKASISDIRIGVSESWQGKERPVMIVDLVRASNDKGSIGFLRKKERLNVLLSRQQQHLFVVGDIECAKESLPPSTSVDTPTKTPIDVTASKRDEQNKWVIRVLKWFKEHGRVANVDKDILTEEFVSFPKQEMQTDEGTLASWGDSAVAEKEAGGNEATDTLGEVWGFQETSDIIEEEWEVQEPTNPGTADW